MLKSIVILFVNFLGGDFMYVAPVITGHGSLPLLISRLRESFPFFDFFCDVLIHDSTFHFFISVLILVFTARFAYRFLCSYSSRFLAYCHGENRKGSFESILNFFFEVDDSSNENELR